MQARERKRQRDHSGRRRDHRRRRGQLARCGYWCQAGLTPPVPRTVGGGGGYGGYGAAGNGLTAYGGTTYGSLTSPTDVGSGGAPAQSSYGVIGGAGGGYVGINVTGTLQVDGRISARGLPGTGASAGGGSGGSINLNVGTLAGSGVISADGGMGNYLGGGGGGGRIAISYGVNDFTGLISAYGGRGYTAGGAGTIYSKAKSQSSGVVVADNGGQAGTNTSVTASGDLIIRGGAVVALPLQSQSFNSLLISSNGWLSVGSISQQLTVLSNAIIQPGGGIIADGTGNAAGIGPGAGRSYSSGSGIVGGGAGYGGYGAAGGATGAYGGSPYGSATCPRIWAAAVLLPRAATVCWAERAAGTFDCRLMEPCRWMGESRHAAFLELVRAPAAAPAGPSTSQRESWRVRA